MHNIVKGLETIYKMNIAQHKVVDFQILISYYYIHACIHQNFYWKYVCVCKFYQNLLFKFVNWN
jgi:hypothetical protein